MANLRLNIDKFYAKYISICKAKEGGVAGLRQRMATQQMEISAGALQEFLNPVFLECDVTDNALTVTV